MVDTGDYNFPVMTDNCTAEQFNKWRHDGLVYLEAHSRWKGATQIFNKLRMSNKPITEGVFDIGVQELEKEQGALARTTRRRSTPRAGSSPTGSASSFSLRRLSLMSLVLPILNDWKI